MVDKPKFIDIPGVDNQVVIAAGAMTTIQKSEPEWLWHETADHTTTYGRWPTASQAPYIRADIVVELLKKTETGPQASADYTVMGPCAAWRVPETPTAGNMRQNYLYLLEHIRDFKGDRVSQGSLSDEELRRMIEMEEAGLVKQEWFNTTNAGRIRNSAPYFILTDKGTDLVASVSGSAAFTENGQ